MRGERGEREERDIYYPTRRCTAWYSVFGIQGLRMGEAPHGCRHSSTPLRITNDGSRSFFDTARIISDAHTEARQSMQCQVLQEEGSYVVEIEFLEGQNSGIILAQPFLMSTSLLAS